QSGMYRAMRDGKQLHAGVEVLWTKSGRALPVELWFYPLFEGDTVNGSVVTFIDISEPLRIEAERAVVETRLSHMMDSSSDAIFMTDQIGTLRYVNQAATTLLGYSREELMSMKFFDLVPEEWRITYRSNLDDLIKNKRQRLMETRLVRKDGTRIPLELNVSCAFDDSLVYGAFRDISARNETAKKMKQLLERFTLATSAAKLGVVDYNIADNLLTFDKIGCELHGFPIQDEYNVDYATYERSLHEEDRPLVQAKVQAAIESHQDMEMQFRVCLPSGQVRNMEAFVKVALDMRGQPLRMLGVCRDITQQKLHEYEINLLAYYDPLTKLPNRRLLQDRLKHALAISAHAKSYGAVLFLDLDHFKNLNDSRGHDIGDMLLLEVSARLLSSVREGDTVARLGGDEFVVILESLSTSHELAMHQTELVAEKLVDLLAQPFDLDGDAYLSGGSIGISLFQGHQDDMEDLLKYADSAMYQAKSAGRGVYRFFDPVMQNRLEQRAALEVELRRALDIKGELELYFQAQVDERQQVRGAELLLRWHHPQRGLVYPKDFIDLAEESGLILQIGDWVLKSAVVQLKVWQEDARLAKLHLAVNVSDKQFRRADFVSKISKLLRTSKIRPESLKLELTETLMLENVSDTIAKMNELKALGVGFSLDDFGTGYSSLSYLKQLPLDQIKIDQSFVCDIISDPNDAAIVVMIIAMSKALGLHVLAEGVETQAQRDFLLENGCHAFQGYLFGKPVPVREFEALV
ncbi:MAG: EAL domain-containing protein, partial [Gallionella sp.]